MKTGVELLPPAEAVVDDHEFQAFTAEIGEAVRTRGPKAHLAFPRDRVVIAGSYRDRASVLTSANSTYVAKLPVWGPTMIEAQAMAMNMLGRELDQTAHSSDIDITTPPHYALVRTPRGIATIMKTIRYPDGQLAQSLYAMRYACYTDAPNNAADAITQEVRQRVPRTMRYLLDDLFARNILCTTNPDMTAQWEEASFAVIDQCHRARTGARLLISANTHSTVPPALARIAPGYVLRLTSTG